MPHRQPSQASSGLNVSISRRVSLDKALAGSPALSVAAPVRLGWGYALFTSSIMPSPGPMQQIDSRRGFVKKVSRNTAFE